MRGILQWCNMRKYVSIDFVRRNYCNLSLLAFCFYGKDQVNLIGGGRRTIEQLKVGDRIWSMTDDTTRLVPDEIILMMHNGPNQAGLFPLVNEIFFSSKTLSLVALFYTFEMADGNELSLAATHTLPVYDPEDKQIKFLRAAKVTTKHRLFMLDQMMEIRNITYNQRFGFFSPLTLSGYLMVNNISASCFSDR